MFCWPNRVPTCKSRSNVRTRRCGFECRTHVYELGLDVYKVTTILSSGALGLRGAQKMGGVFDTVVTIGG